MEEINPNHEETEVRFDKSRDLTAVEHATLLGSSITYRGKPYNWATFKEQADSGQIDPDALVPKGVEDGSSDEELMKLEARRTEQRDLVGIFPFLDEDIDKLPPGYSVRIQGVGNVDRETLEVDHVYRLSVVNQYGIDAPQQYLGNIKLAPTHTSYFDMKDSKDGGKLLILTIQDHKK